MGSYELKVNETLIRENKRLVIIILTPNKFLSTFYIYYFTF